MAVLNARQQYYVDLLNHDFNLQNNNMLNFTLKIMLIILFKLHMKTEPHRENFGYILKI